MATKPFASGHLLAAADVNDLVGVYDRSTSAVDVVSTIVETTLYSKAIGAGHMSTDRLLRLTMFGDMLNNTGTSEAFTIRVGFGGTAIWQGTFSIATDSADRRDWEMTVKVANLGSASLQQVSVLLGFGDATTPPIGISGSNPGFATAATAAAATATMVTVVGGTAAVDTATAKTLTVTAQPTVSSANMSIRKKFAVLELL